jgi:hypothetical protein
MHLRERLAAGEPLTPQQVVDEAIAALTATNAQGGEQI